MFEEACNEKKIVRIPESPNKRKWFIPEIKSKLIIPMVNHKDKVIGLINLSSKKENAFGKNDEIRLGHLTKHTGIAIGMKEECNSKLKMLSCASDDLMANLDSPKLLDRMVEWTRKIADCEVCSLYLVTEDRDYLELKKGCGYPKDKEEIFKATSRLKITDGVGTGLTGWVATRGETLRLNGKGIIEHPAWRGTERTKRLEYLKSGKCFSLIITPIKGKDGALLGVLKVENKLGSDGKPTEEIEFTQDDELLFRILAQKIGLCLEIAGSIKAKEEADRIIKEFWRTTSHSLRSPIHTILESFDQLEEETPELETNDLFQILKQENYRFARYVKNLLYLTRTEIGALKLIKEEFDIAELMERLKILFKRPFKLYKVEFGYKSSTKDTYVYADKDAVLDVLINLLTNAINAIRQTERGRGIIRISIAPYYKRFLKIEIADNGIGIEGLGDLNQMIEKAKKEKRKLGLGLGICNKIIKEHNGELWMKKNPEGGAIFGFTLPRR